MWAVTLALYDIFYENIVKQCIVYKTDIKSLRLPIPKMGSLLHIHASSCKNVTEFISEERNSGDAFFLGAVALL